MEALLLAKIKFFTDITAEINETESWQFYIVQAKIASLITDGEPEKNIIRDGPLENL